MRQFLASSQWPIFSFQLVSVPFEATASFLAFAWFLALNWTFQACHQEFHFPYFIFPSSCEFECDFDGFSVRPSSLHSPCFRPPFHRVCCCELSMAFPCAPLTLQFHSPNRSNPSLDDTLFCLSFK